MVEVCSMTIADHWHDLVTVSLLGTDRRDPPEPPPGPLADVVDDVAAVSPSERMLAAVGACVAARRAGIIPRPPAPGLSPPDDDERPMVPPAAARRWRTIVRLWSVLEDEWLLEAERAGWRPSPDVLVELLQRHRTDTARLARVVRFGGPLARWLYEHQPALRPSPSSRRPPIVDDDLPALAVPPTLLPLLSAPPAPVVAGVVGGFVEGTFGLAHRAVLINFVARARPDSLEALSEALGGEEVPTEHAGLAHLLADLAATRHRMRHELGL